LTEESYYLSSALPNLYEITENYDRLIEAVINGEILPQNELSDVRALEFMRLEYAIKAAIIRKRYKDILNLSLLAGEKDNSQTRMYELFQENFDVLSQFISRENLREAAFRGYLRSGWLGSNQLYTSALLSSYADGKIDSKPYLRNAREFLNLYYKYKIICPDINWQLDLKELEILGDVESLLIAFENILDNQIRFAKQKIKIDITDQEEIVISNDGPRFSIENLDDLFESHTKDKQGNFGLGLAIVKRVIRIHGGEVSARNTIDGVKFAVVFNRK